jgi:hypothetical protein
MGSIMYILVNNRSFSGSKYLPALSGEFPRMSRNLIRVFVVKREEKKDSGDSGVSVVSILPTLALPRSGTGVCSQILFRTTSSGNVCYICLKIRASYSRRGSGVKRI